MPERLRCEPARTGTPCQPRATMGRCAGSCLPLAAQPGCYSWDCLVPAPLSGLLKTVAIIIVCGVWCVCVWCMVCVVCAVYLCDVRSVVSVV